MTERLVPAADARNGIFRDAALARLNSPEQLNQRIAIIPPGMRLLGAALAVIVLACLAWGVFGSIPTRVSGRGVLLSDKEGNFSIASVTSGLVLEMLVKPGDHVGAGAEIARIEQKLLSARIQNAIDQVARLEVNLAELRAVDAEQISKSDETARRQQAALDENLTAGAVRRDRLRDMVTAYAGLRSKGLVAEKEVMARQSEYDQTALDIANAKSKKIEIEATAQKTRDDLAETERQKKVEIDTQKAEVDKLRVEMTVGSIVRAPISGVIREVRLGRGDVASAGAVLATIGQDGSEHVEVMALLQGPARKRVAVGMKAHIVPDGTKKEEYGSMRGRVAWVSRQRRVERACRAAPAQRSTDQKPVRRGHATAGPDRTGSFEDDPQRLCLVGRVGASIFGHPRNCVRGRYRGRRSAADQPRHSGAAQAPQSRGIDRPGPSRFKAPGPHANRPPDGDGGMRRGGARHRARLLRTARAARGTARDLRRLARRQQGQRHRAGGAELRA